MDVKYFPKRFEPRNFDDELGRVGSGLPDMLSREATMGKLGRKSTFPLVPVSSLADSTAYISDPILQ